jgi:hypothetical protein
MPTYSALKFDKGMTPKVFTKDSATRIEHFDTITEVLRPFRTLVASSNNQGVATTALGLIGFEILNDTIYAVGKEHTSGVCGAIYKWDTSAFEWQSEQSLTATNVAQSMLQAHGNYLFGIQSSRYLYRFSPPTTFSLTFYDCGTIVNGFAEAITHSKDGIMYFATDNKIHKVTSDGATGSLALTLPNANFRVTSLCEQGNFVNIVGYDVKSGQSSSLIWDRDTSVVDLTESYALGRDFAIHNATLLGTTFFVQVRINTTNSSFSEKQVLIIKYLNGNTVDTLYEFPVSSLSIVSTVNNMVGAKYQSLDRLYFTAKVQFDGDSAERNICFALDHKGRLTIAQNVTINTGTNPVTGILRDGEAFWFGAGTDGAWNTTSTYATTSAFETNDIRSDNLGLNIQLVEAYITCESLPASSSIILKARKNAETTFTTLKTYDTDGHTKLKLTAQEAVNGLVGLDSARNVRFRIESTGGAVITGFQSTFKDVPDTGNG